MRWIALGLALAALAACGDGISDVDDIDPSGLWHGVTEDSSLVVEVGIQSYDGGVLVGCIALGWDPHYRPNDRVTVAAVGTASPMGSVTMRPAAGWDPIATFEGTIGKTLPGRITPAGQGPMAVDLERVSGLPNCPTP